MSTTTVKVHDPRSNPATAHVTRRSGREVRGQLVRLIAAGPGSATGRRPVGNTGRAPTPATRSGPVRNARAHLWQAAGR